jgi:hypothetical protein
MKAVVGSKNALRLSCLLSIAAVGAGCVAGAGGDGPTGKDQQEVSTVWTALGGNGWPGAFTSLPDDTEATCFLTAVAGDLTVNEGFPEGTALAGVVDDVPNQTLQVIPGDLNSIVEAGTWCLNTTASTPVQRWQTGQAATIMRLANGDPVPVNANTACFLTRVMNLDDPSVNEAFSHTGDLVKVFTNTVDHISYWYIGGSGDAWGEARCVTNFTWVGSTGSETNPSSDFSWNMVQAPDTGSSPLGTQCLLQGVGGSFRDDDFSDGVSVQYASGTLWWSLNVSAHKTAYVNCVQ